LHLVTHCFRENRTARLDRGRHLGRLAPASEDIPYHFIFGRPCPYYSRSKRSSRSRPINNNSQRDFGIFYNKTVKISKLYCHHLRPHEAGKYEFCSQPLIVVMPLQNNTFLCHPYFGGPQMRNNIFSKFKNLIRWILTIPHFKWIISILKFFFTLQDGNNIFCDFRQNWPPLPDSFFTDERYCGISGTARIT
jgi:hypothetical protein